MVFRVWMPSALVNVIARRHAVEFINGDQLRPMSGFAFDFLVLNHIGGTLQRRPLLLAICKNLAKRPANLLILGGARFGSALEHLAHVLLGVELARLFDQR